MYKTISCVSTFFLAKIKKNATIINGVTWLLTYTKLTQNSIKAAEKVNSSEALAGLACKN